MALRFARVLRAGERAADTVDVVRALHPDLATSPAWDDETKTSTNGG